MLGRLRRTTRLDVGLAIGFVGIAFLVWAFVAGISRAVVQEMIRSTMAMRAEELPNLTRVVKIFYVDAGFLIDLVGLAWLIGSLVLVALSSRQKLRISWAWVSAISQVCVAAVGATLVGWAAYKPYILDTRLEGTAWEQVSTISLPVITVVAILIWVTFLVWLLVERARYRSRGPTLSDGLRTNVYK